MTSYFDVATQEGATIRTGGTRYGDHGFFVAPTPLEEVTADMRVAREEIFGLVTALMSFTDLDAGFFVSAPVLWSRGRARVMREAAP